MEFAAAALSAISSTLAPAAAVGTSSTAVAGALAPLTVGGVQAAVAGTAASGGILSSLGGLSGIGGILSGAATIGSMLSTQRAGDDAAWAYEQKALDAGINIKAEQVAGQERKLSLSQALIKQLGERDVQTAASGVDLSFGSPVVARAQDVADSERALAADASTTDIRVSRLRQSADMYRVMGNNAKSGALAKAAGLGLTGAAALLRRG